MASKAAKKPSGKRGAAPGALSPEKKRRAREATRKASEKKEQIVSETQQVDVDQVEQQQVPPESNAERIMDNDVNGARTGVTPRAATESGDDGQQPAEPRVRAPRARREDSAVSQAIQMLRSSTEPMSAREMYEAGTKVGLFAGLKGKTPIATLNAQLYLAEKRGDVTRPEKGKFAAPAEKSAA